MHRSNSVVAAGGFFCILGLSGCRKTTILRSVSGCVQPSSDRILIGDQDLVGLVPNERETALIFQSRDFFLFMPVWEDMAFGLEARRMSKRDRRAKTDELLHRGPFRLGRKKAW